MKKAKSTGAGFAPVLNELMEVLAAEDRRVLSQMMGGENNKLGEAGNDDNNDAPQSKRAGGGSYGMRLPNVVILARDWSRVHPTTKRLMRPPISRLGRPHGACAQVARASWGDLTERARRSIGSFLGRPHGACAQVARSPDLSAPAGAVCRRPW